MSGDLIASLLAIHQLFEVERVPHALCGGLAANLYRDEVRATSDVDLAIILESAKLAMVVEALAEQGWRSEPYWKHGNQLRLSRDGFARVDCIIAGTDLERSAIMRAAIAGIDGNEVPVLTPEDLITLKLIAGRARDIEAVAAILVARGDTLDVDYIHGWLEQFDATAAWDRAVADADRER